MDELAFQRWAAKTERQQVIVTQMVQEAGGELTRHERAALAHTLHRSKEAVQSMVEKARETLAGNAVEYVDVHKQTVMKASQSDDPKALEVAVRGSQWAMEHISFNGKRVVDKTGGSEGSGSVIQIGIKLGGRNEDVKETVIDAVAVPAQIVEKVNE